MFEIRPSTLYSRADLAEALKPLGIDVDFFVARIQPVKRFRLAFWGADLIAAIDAAPALSEPPSARPASPAKRSPAPQRAGRRNVERELESLKRLARGEEFRK